MPLRSELQPQQRAGHRGARDGRDLQRRQAPGGAGGCAVSNVQPVPAAAPAPVEFRYTQTDSVPAVLRELGASLVITTYQANKLLVARATDDGLSMLVRTFDRPMGLAMRDGRMALGCRNEVWEFRNAPDIAPRVEPQGVERILDFMGAHPDGFASLAEAADAVAAYVPHRPRPKDLNGLRKNLRLGPRLAIKCTRPNLHVGSTFGSPSEPGREEFPRLVFHESGSVA